MEIPVLNANRPCLDAAFCGVWSGSTLFADAPFMWFMEAGAIVFCTCICTGLLTLITHAHLVPLSVTKRSLTT